VFYDGILTSQLNLDALRSNVTIIPQLVRTSSSSDSWTYDLQPELLSGTLRRNLDPFEQHDDATLNAALRAAGLFSLQTETDEARLTLDSDISGGGNNLSVGQRQIIALARAMVRNSKLLILDEGKSSSSIALARNNVCFFCSYIRNWYGVTLSNEISDSYLFSERP
jgi:ABC-type multidrug transport system fused ATPase/permease subunit